MSSSGRLLDTVESPKDVRSLPESELPRLCEELREDIIDVCGSVGGHLGASLGTVELTVALHRIYKTPHDAIVFDVGHQAYAHKMLTGRRGRMKTLRQEGGIAPFQDRAESPHDAFGAGHACTAISAALGMREAMVLKGDTSHHAVAVVGDGALTGGLSFEGLNNAGASGVPLTVVLNDNGMSISANVGAVHGMLRGGGARAFFEALGFTYLGPVDGHDLTSLLSAFREARNSRRPVLLHAVTQKGKGFFAAEDDAQTRGHAMGPYELRDGKLVRSRQGLPTFSDAFADALEAKMAKDSRVVCVTPAMLEGSALVRLKNRFPVRVFDVGIAEQHAVTFSAGLATQGLLPVCCIYSTFLQRGFDSVVHDVCLQKLPVVFAIDRAGLVGADGATHQGAYDVSFLRPLPNLRLMAPVVGDDCAALLDLALEGEGASAIRFPRGTLPPEPTNIDAVSASGARWLHRAAEGSGVGTVVSLGPLGLFAREAALETPGWSALDARHVLPLDEAALLEAARSGRVLVVEEGTRHGGLGSAVLELFAARGVKADVRLLGLPDAPVRHGDARAQRAALGLDAAGLRRAMQDFPR